LENHLPEADYHKPLGGYYFWVKLMGRDTNQLRQSLQGRKVDIRPGTLFSSQNGLENYLRLSISYHQPAELETGVQRLADAIRE
jgi:DNA-binding transcriptional MocR family regulator